MVGHMRSSIDFDNFSSRLIMAKSLRSKVKRKMRALKRIKNAPKELARLKKTLGIDVLMDTEVTDLVTGNTIIILYRPFSVWLFMLLLLAANIYFMVARLCLRQTNYFKL